MQTKGYGKIRKTKAYGAIGVITLASGLMLALNTTTYADEVTTDTQTDLVTTESQTTDGETSKLTQDVTVDNTEQTIDDVDSQAESATDSNTTEESTTENIVSEKTSDDVQETSTNNLKPSETTSSENIDRETSKLTQDVTVDNTEQTIDDVDSQAESATDSNTTEESTTENIVSEKTSDDVQETSTNNLEPSETTSSENIDEPITIPEQKDNSIDTQNITKSESESTQTLDVTNQPSNVSSDVNTVTESKVTTTPVKQEVTDVDVSSKGFELHYNGTIQEGAKIMFAVWSDVNGQDDLVWYTADSNGNATAKYTGTYGLYNIHTYQNLNGQMIGLNGRTYDLAKPSAKAKIEKTSATTYTVTIYDVPAYMTSIVLPTWTENNGQDDIVWYNTSIHEDGTYTHTFSIAEHNLESGRYNVHVYGTSAVTGQLTGLLGTSTDVDYKFGDIQITAEMGSNGIEINMPKDVAQDLSISHAVWSEANGQDDIIWYGDTTGHVTAHYTGSYGTYLVHTYANIKGKMVGIGATTVNIPKPSATVTISKSSATTYTVTVSNVPAYISNVSLPIWTAKGDQDDIIWYSATKNADGTYSKTFSITDHNFESGKYNVHYYGTSAVTRSLTGLGGTTFNCDYQFGDIQITANMGETGIEITMPKDVASATTVSHAVWSKINDQDDLKWYADSTGHVTAPYSGDYGTYLVHTYANVNGKMICIGATTIDIPKPSVTTTITKISESEVRVDVSNVPVYMKDIQLPTWTDANGQDDIKWYQATKNSDGTYTLTFYAKDHNLESGHYNIHVYGTSNVTGKLTALSGTSGVTLNTDGIVTEPTVKVQNYDANGGTLEVYVAETSTSKHIANVRVAAWSESNQSNLYWYQPAEIKNGVVVLTVNEKYHNYIKGDYTVHVYVDFSDATTSGFNLGQYTFNADKPAQAQSYFIDISSYNGVISVTEYQSLKNQGITGVVVKLTEGNSYTNPYAQAQIANAQAAGMKVSAYYYAHYSNASEAVSEAQYFAQTAERHGLGKDIVMVNDMESQNMLTGDINANTQIWTDEMKRLGYNNIVYYTMASWLDICNGRISTSQFGFDNFWVAHYVNGYTYLDQESAKTLGYYSSAAAWQYTSVSPKLSHNLDESIDYSGRFTI